MTNVAPLCVTKRTTRYTLALLPVERIEEDRLSSGIFSHNKMRGHNMAKVTMADIYDHRAKIKSFISQFLLVGLSFSEKKVLVLRFYRSYTWVQISRRMNIPTREVKGIFEEASIKIKSNHRKLEESSSAGHVEEKMSTR